MVLLPRHCLPSTAGTSSPTSKTCGFLVLVLRLLTEGAGKNHEFASSETALGDEIESARLESDKLAERYCGGARQTEVCEESDPLRDCHQHR
eukprot:764207-Hanusia_phi.AAC.3